MRSRRILILVAAAVLVAAGGWYFARPKPVSVVLAAVDRGPVERWVANTRAATVTACRRAKLAPLSGGQIAKLRVREGERVKAGQVLLELWNETLEAEARVAEDQLKAARLRAEEACLSADLAQREAGRAQQLRDQGFVSAEHVDRAVSEAAARAAGCRAANADVQQARTRIEAVRAQLSRTYLHAPFAGVVAKVTGELGEITAPSPPGIPTPPVIDLIDDSCLYITAPIDEVDAPAIRIGMPARISVDAFPGRKFKGHVRRIAPYVLDVEKQARTVDVEVEFSDRKETSVLLVGYSADVEIVLDARADALRVPTAAIQEGNRVLVYLAGAGVLEERKIATGLFNWEYTEITSGLSAGDQVVLSLERPGVRAGARARPEAANPRGGTKAGQ
jgi:HlyD family secretion protein